MKKIKKMGVIAAVIFCTFTVPVFALPAQAYTQEEKQMVKDWLSANGYPPTMDGAYQAYQDYLDGKFDLGESGLPNLEPMVGELPEDTETGRTQPGTADQGNQAQGSQDQENQIQENQNQADQAQENQNQSSQDQENQDQGNQNQGSQDQPIPDNGEIASDTEDQPENQGETDSLSESQRESESEAQRESEVQTDIGNTFLIGVILAALAALALFLRRKEKKREALEKKK